MPKQCGSCAHWTTDWEVVGECHFVLPYWAKGNNTTWDDDGESCPTFAERQDD